MKRCVLASLLAPTILLILSSGRLTAQAVANATIHGKEQNIFRVVGSLPEQLAVARIQRDDTFVRRREVHRTIPDDRRRLLLSVIGDIGSPRHAQGGDIGLLDLGQGGIAISGIGFGGQQPVGVILPGV